MKKTILFHIYQILKMFSDEEHPITRREIQKLLESQYDIHIESTRLHLISIPL